MAGTGWARLAAGFQPHLQLRQLLALLVLLGIGEHVCVGTRGEAVSVGTKEADDVNCLLKG